MLLELLIELIGGADVSHSFSFLFFFFFSFFSFQLVNGLDRPRYVCETEVMEEVNVATATPVEYTPPGNTNKNANGNIITLTLKNNHLIVETEERAVSNRIFCVFINTPVLRLGIRSFLPIESKSIYRKGIFSIIKREISIIGLEI